jgi:hypothetical protein
MFAQNLDSFLLFSLKGVCSDMIQTENPLIQEDSPKAALQPSISHSAKDVDVHWKKPPDTAKSQLTHRMLNVDLDSLLFICTTLP